VSFSWGLYSLKFIPIGTRISAVSIFYLVIVLISDVLLSRKLRLDWLCDTPGDRTGVNGQRRH
jgi:hypothetical protein